MFGTNQGTNNNLFFSNNNNNNTTNIFENGIFKNNNNNEFHFSSSLFNNNTGIFNNTNTNNINFLNKQNQTNFLFNPSNINSINYILQSIDSIPTSVGCSYQETIIQDSKDKSSSKFLSITADSKFSSFSFEEIRYKDIMVKTGKCNVNQNEGLFNGNLLTNKKSIFLNNQPILFSNCNPNDTKNIFSQEIPLFGNNNNNQTSLFGNNNNNQTNLYGINNNNNNSLFGNNNNNNNQTSLLGINTNNNNSLYGINNNNNNSLFGNPNHQNNLFSNNNNNNNQTSLFGNNANNKNDIFGNNTNNQNQLFGNTNHQNSLFGNNNNNNNNQTSLFGNNANNKNDIFGNSLFGNNNNNNSPLSLFGNTNNQNSLFGNNNNNNNPSSLFGNNTINKNSLFGNNNNNNNPVSLFGNNTINKNSLFGNNYINNDNNLQSLTNNSINNNSNSIFQNNNNYPAPIVQNNNPSIFENPNNYSFANIIRYPNEDYHSLNSLDNPSLLNKDINNYIFGKERKIKPLFGELSNDSSNKKDIQIDDEYESFKEYKDFLNYKRMAKKYKNTIHKETYLSPKKENSISEKKNKQLFEPIRSEFFRKKKNNNQQLTLRNKAHSFDMSKKYESRIITNLETSFNQNLNLNDFPKRKKDSISLNLHIQINEPFRVTFSIDVTKNTKMNEFKEKICETLIQKNSKYKNIKANSFILMKKYTIVKENEIIEKCNFENGDKIYLILKESIIKNDNNTNNTIKFETTKQIKKNELASLDKIPKLTKIGYKTNPSMTNIYRMTLEELENVENFSIENENGRIEFETKVNLTSLDLDIIIDIKPGILNLYDKKNTMFKPSPGFGLNQKAIIHLYNISELHNDNEEDVLSLKFQEDRIKKIGGEFIEYNSDNEEFIYRVEHF